MLPSRLSNRIEFSASSVKQSQCRSCTLVWPSEASLARAYSTYPRHARSTRQATSPKWRRGIWIAWVHIQWRSHELGLQLNPVVNGAAAEQLCRDRTDVARAGTNVQKRQAVVEGERLDCESVDPRGRQVQDAVTDWDWSRNIRRVV